MQAWSLLSEFASTPSIYPQGELEGSISRKLLLSALLARNCRAVSV